MYDIVYARVGITARKFISLQAARAVHSGIYVQLYTGTGVTVLYYAQLKLSVKTRGCPFRNDFPAFHRS